jgi:transposase-like protein
MPWAAKSITEARREFVMHALLPNSNIRRLCRRFNISPNTAYQTLARYRAEGDAGLQDRSRKPHHCPRPPRAAAEQEAGDSEPLLQVLVLEPLLELRLPPGQPRC